MSNEIIVATLGVSLVLGFFGLLAFLWGLKNNQFDDENKMMEGVLFDSADDLNRMANTRKKQNFLQQINSQKTDFENSKNIKIFGSGAITSETKLKKENV